MILRCSSLPQDRGEAGFTLIEIVVVLAVLGFALVLLIGYKPPWSRGFDLDTTATELAAQLRLTRSAAIAENQAVALELDLPGHLYRSGKSAPHRLPNGLAVELLTVAGERLGANIGGIRFHPDGSSTGGRIVLADGRRRVVVGVDWLSGRVSIANVR